MINIQLDDVGKLIQLSIAPVFLLAGIGQQLLVLTNRLGRIIDRARVLEEKLITGALTHRTELEELHDRSHLINRAIALSCLCALLICLVIVCLFLEDAANLNLAKLIGAMFVLGIVSLITSFVFFLREIFVATKGLERDRLRGQTNKTTK